MGSTWRLPGPSSRFLPRLGRKRKHARSRRCSRRPQDGADWPLGPRLHPGAPPLVLCFASL